MADGLAALLGWLLGAGLLAVSASMALTEMWEPALLLGHGGLMLWAWALVRQTATED